MKRSTNIFFHRRKGEQIIIGEGPSAITITVTATSGKNCTLSMHAPEEIKIDRAERRLDPQT